MAAVICPICRLALEQGAKTWTCERGHSFDRAREGYVNLLPVQQKNSRDHGDDPQMVMARRAFLEAGHYRPLRDAVLALLATLKPQTLLDVGCGEGDYTSAFTDIATDVVGLDIARTAIRLAARRFHNITWLVGSGAQLPIADASMDVVTNLFTQLHVGEMQRVLGPKGHVLVVTPSPRHLWTLREQLFDEVREHDPDKFLSDFSPAFELIHRETVQVPLRLSQAALQQLLQMTPYAWKARPERRIALADVEDFQTEAAFSLLLMRKIN